MSRPILYEKRCHYTPIGEIPEGPVALYRAYDETLDRIVGVKQVMIPGEDKRSRSMNLDKALGEVRLLIRAGEENLPVPAIYDRYYDERASVLYIFMEWIKGDTLRSCMGHPQQVLVYMRDLCAILRMLDKMGIHHKDVKPENLMITKRGELRLIDFNISGSLPNLAEGTYFYKAPEMSSEKLGADRSRSDMFSIGVILYESYTGVLPRPGIAYSAGKDLNWKRFREPIQENPELPPAVNRLITRCMKRQPRDRFRDYGELFRELGRVIAQTKHHTPKP